MITQPRWAQSCLNHVLDSTYISGYNSILYYMQCPKRCLKSKVWVEPQKHTHLMQLWLPFSVDHAIPATWAASRPSATTRYETLQQLCLRTFTTTLQLSHSSNPLPTNHSHIALPTRNQMPASISVPEVSGAQTKTHFSMSRFSTQTRQATAP